MLMKTLLIFLIGFMAMTGCSRLNSEIQDVGEESAYEETVARAKEELDDTWVTLNGKIVEKIGDSLYIFRDSTGEIKVRIDDQTWGGQEFKLGMKVKLTGKVDKGFTGFEIAVSKVEVLNR